MKVKMVKMGMDIDETRNHRIRGIIPTKDEKYLFVEILQGRRLDKKYFKSLTSKQYELKYPNPEYIWVDFCFRVDIPEEHYRNYSPEYEDFEKNSFYELAYTKDNIVKLLQKLNPDIDEVELVDDYYIDKFCEEKGFFELYDNRLKHHNKLKEVIWVEPSIEGKIHYKYEYTCYAVNGTKYSEIRETKGKINKLIEEYGKDNVKPLVTAYVKDICSHIIKSDKVQEHYNQFLKDVFENDKDKLSVELDEEYIDI